MSTFGRPSSDRDDGWRRGFAEPDPDEDDPPRNASRQPAVTVGAGVFEGVDDHGVIRVTVDRSGLVADVVVAPTWRDTIGPRELGHALLTAANNALLSHLADAIERNPESPSPDTVAPTTLLPPGLAMSEAADLLNRFDRDFEAYRRQLEEAVTFTATASGPNGRVTVTMSQGLVAEVTADPRWASHIRHTAIRAEARQAFQSATQEIGRTDPAAVPLPPSLSRLRELSVSSNITEKGTHR
jgi:hypothetical protein